MSSSPADFLPSAPLIQLQRRAELLTVVREFFRSRGYWEVETPILSTEMVLDAWLEPFVAGYLSDPVRWSSGGRPCYLQTSPEAHMKRLLAAGAEAIFQVSRVFRNGESGRRHNPEFTMLEWYRVGDNHIRQMEFVEQLVRQVFAGSQQWRPAGSLADSAEPFERLAYDDAFARYAGQRVLQASVEELRDLSRRRCQTVPAGLAAEDRDGWLNFLLAELVEPQLGRDRPTFLYDYPASQAALARITAPTAACPAVAERFELYVQGIELCNGYHELTDAAALRQRTLEQQALRHQSGLRPLPGAPRLCTALQSGIPACSGVALGFDRLVMLAVGADCIDQVLAFPFDRA